jgi:hypothetical protein
MTAVGSKVPLMAKTCFEVGDRIRFKLGARRVVGRVVEDPRFIGVDGRQLVRFEVTLDPT